MRRLKGWAQGTWAYLRADRVAMMVVGGAFVGGALAAIPGADAAFNYTWRNAEFCDDCHVHDYANEAYARSLHAGVTTCHDCHLVPFMHYPMMAWDAATKTFTGPEDFVAAHVPTMLCEGCHSKKGEAHRNFTGPMTPELLAGTVTVDDSPMHKVHMEATSRDPGNYRGGGEFEQASDDERHHSVEEVQSDAKHAEGAILCMDCHGSSNNRAHQFRPSRDNCLQCHGGMAHSGGRLDTLVCQECHFDRFLGAKPTQGAGEANAH